MCLKNRKKGSITQRVYEWTREIEYSVIINGDDQLSELMNSEASAEKTESWVE